MALLLIVVAEVSLGKENEKDTTGRTVSAKEVESTTIKETAITETVKIDKVAAEPTTEQAIELYDVPLEEQLQHYIMTCVKRRILRQH